MIVVDTSAWIECIGDGPVADQVGSLLPPQSRCVIPTIVQLELARWLLRETTSDVVSRILAFVGEGIVAPLDSDIALLAAELGLTLKLATADAIIYATTTHYGAGLLTCDAHFQGLPGVLYFENKH